MIDGVGFDRIDVVDGAAGATQPVVERVGERVDGRRLLLARYHDAGGAVALQIPGQGFDPGMLHRCPCVARLRAHRQRHAQLLRQLARQQLQLAGAQGQAVVGHASRAGRRALDDVETAQVAVVVVQTSVAGQAPPLGELAGVADVAGTGVGEIGVE